MGLDDLMAKIRRWDNICAKWMMRHFYFFFFQVILILVFFAFFINVITVIDLGEQLDPTSVVQQLLHHNAASMLLIVFLMLLGSFWLLFMFNGMNRIRLILKDIHYTLMRDRYQKK